MSRCNLAVFIFAFAALLSLSACSSSKNTPITPGDNSGINYPSNADELASGRNYLGAYTMNFDPETWETEVVPDRNSDSFHFKITSYLFSPPCPAKGCFQFFIRSLNGTVFTIDMYLANPTSIIPNDVRQIFTGLYGKKVMNPDGYTDLFDPPSTPETINPFIAWAKEEPKRAFPGPWIVKHQELLLDFPPGAHAQTSYIFECSLGGNTEEPYSIQNSKQYGVLPNLGGTTVVLSDIFDWQNDISKATIDTSLVNGRITNFSLIPSTNTYRAFVNNYLQVPVGTYPALIKAESPNAYNISMYNYVNIEVSNAPFSDNLPVSDCLECDASTEAVGQKCIAMASPNVWVAYSDDRMGPGIYHTRVQKGENSGQNFLPSVKVSGAPSITDTYASIAQDGDNIYVTWTWSDGFNTDVKFARSIDGGATYEAEMRPHPDPYISFQGGSNICVDPDGNVIIVYEDDSFGLGIDIAMLVSTDKGLTWGQPIRVNNDTGDKGQFSPSIASDLYGNLAIVWEDKRNTPSGFSHGDIYITSTSNLGETFGANIKVNDSNGTGLIDPSPAIALYITGGAYVAWAADIANDANIYMDYASNRINFGTDIRVNDDIGNNARQFDPSINVNLVGTVYISWTDERNGNKDIYFADSTTTGIFNPNTIVNTDTTVFNQFASSIASDFLGRAYIVWSDARNTRSTSKQEIFYAFRR